MSDDLKAFYTKLTLDFLRDTGFADQINENGTILLYHGTSKKNADAILGSGQFKGFPFFSPDPAIAKRFANYAGKNPVVIPVLLAPEAVVPTADYFSARHEGLHRQEGDVWNIPDFDPEKKQTTHRSRIRKADDESPSP